MTARQQLSFDSGVIRSEGNTHASSRVSTRHHPPGLDLGQQPLGQSRLPDRVVGLRRIDLPPIDPLPDVRIRRGQPTPGQGEDFTGTHPGEQRRVSRSIAPVVPRAPKHICTSFIVIARRTGFFASLGVNSSSAGLRSTWPSATAISKICFRSHRR